MAEKEKNEEKWNKKEPKIGNKINKTEKINIKVVKYNT